MSFKSRILAACCFFLVPRILLADADRLNLADLAPSAPMKFLYFTPCWGSSNSCGEHLLAVGTIQADSAEKLAVINPKRGTDIYFHSPGGDLFGALKLGKTVRSLGLNSIVGDSVTREISVSEQISTDESRVVIDQSICASACTFAFLGGLRRDLGDPKCFLLHQFFTELRVSSESTVQKTVALLNQYVELMGIHREVLDAMLVTDPEKLTYYNRADLAKLNVINGITTETIDNKARWKLEFATDNLPIVVNSTDNFEKNGQVEYSFRQKTDSVEFRTKVVWARTTDSTRRASAFKALTTRTHYDMRLQKEVPNADQIQEVSFCSYKSAPKCQEQIPKLKVPLNQWLKISEYDWQFDTTLNRSVYELLVKWKPTTISLDCNIPGYLSEFNFCDDIPLTPEFWQLFGLLRPIEQPVSLWEGIVKRLFN